MLTDVEFKKQVADIIHKEIGKTSRVILFGSRAEGNNRENSDYDICIDNDVTIPGHKMQEIREKIEALPVLWKIDLSDYANLNRNFREKIREKGIVLG